MIANLVFWLKRPGVIEGIVALACLSFVLYAFVAFYVPRSGV